MNTPEIRTIKLSDLVFDESIYPRKTHNPQKVGEYSTNLGAIEAAKQYLHISKNNKLLDGRHRHLAYLTKHGGDADVDIPVYVHDVSETKDEYLIAIELNSQHGQQLSQDDKKQNCINLYAKFGYPLETIAKIVSVSRTFVQNATKTIRENEEAERNEKIFDMYLSCHTQQEIAEAVGKTQQTIDNREKEIQNLTSVSKFVKLSAMFEDDGFSIPHLNVWRFSKSSNSVDHFGMSEQAIVENLLYLYTEPFDIVVDPFAGGGSTIDVCKKRLRRYWTSDRKPIPAREHEIRLHDIKDGVPPLNKRWSDVSLTYLDPPYWRQAAGQYSDDAEDLANQTLEEFTNNMVSFVVDVAKRQSKGAIALIIQPTQWKSDNKEFVDHVFDIIQGVKAANAPLVLENRVSCPYNSEQYMPQMVNYAKENKKLLVLTRELIIWRCAQ